MRLCSILCVASFVLLAAPSSALRQEGKQERPEAAAYAWNGRYSPPLDGIGENLGNLTTRASSVIGRLARIRANFLVSGDAAAAERETALVWAIASSVEPFDGQANALVEI